MRCKRYGDDFLVDKIKPDEIGTNLASMGDLVSDNDRLIINDDENFWQKDHSVPERERDLEKTQKREHTNLRILEWIHGLPTDGDEKQSIQQAEISAAKHMKQKKHIV